MIRLSASMIADILSCPRKGYYRINKGEESVQTDEMLTGTLVHKVLENKWQSRQEAVAEINSLLEQYPDLPEKLRHRARKSVNNFFVHFAPELNDKDVIEKLFNCVYKDDIVFVGKMDRIHNGVVFDWKTGDASPEDINRSPQFIMYYLAYNKLYNKPPSALVYAALGTGKRYLFQPKKKYMHDFEETIIPFVTQIIKSNSFVRTGMYTFFGCYKCPFIKVCYKELDNE